MNTEFKDRVRQSVWLGLSTILFVNILNVSLDGEPFLGHILTNIAAVLLLSVASFGLDQREEWDKGKRWTY